jgi:cytidine deaminase
MWSVNELVREAWCARERAYAPYSRFKVGAAIVTASGDIFHGCNVEIVSLGLTMCAERSAAIVATSAGHRVFLAIAVVAQTTAAISPCGACRQFLAEFSPDLQIISEGIDGVTAIWKLSELLPIPFTEIGPP